MKTGNVSRAVELNLQLMWHQQEQRYKRVLHVKWHTRTHALLHPLTPLLSPRGLSFPSVKHLHVNKRQLNAGCSHLLIISYTMHRSANVEQQEPYSARNPLPPSTLGKTDAHLEIHICCSFNTCSHESHKTSRFTPKIERKNELTIFA